MSPRRTTASRLVWFVALWLLGVGATGVIALVIRTWLKA